MSKWKSIQLPVSWYQNADVLKLFTHSRSAVGVFLMLATYCSDRRTGGKFSEMGAKYVVRATDDELKILEDFGWIKRIGLDKRGNILYRIVGFRRYNPYARDPIPKELREAVYERDGYKCVNCGSTEHLSLDHIYPWILGGEDTYDNLQTMCRSCNSRKGAKTDAHKDDTT